MMIYFTIGMFIGALLGPFIADYFIRKYDRR